MHPLPILFEELRGVGGNLGLVTLNRPQALNALTHEMIILLHQKLLEWENASDIKAVVIQATPGKAFCAGGDLRLVYDKHLANDPTLIHLFRDEYRLNHYIFHYAKPYIAFLDGITMGGGAGISIHGSHRIGTEHLLFAMPETGIGFFPDVGGTYFLSRLPYGLGFYLGLTGSRLSVDDCLDIQLINYKIKNTDLSSVVTALVETPFHDKPKDSVSRILAKFHQSQRSPSLTEHYPFINRYFTKHSIEEILSTLKQHNHSWCQKTISILNKKSPTSLKVTLRQLHEGLKRDFNQCIQLEYLLMCHFIQSHDFYEGIRAVLIEKSQTPQWQPAKLNDVSEETIESFFMPLKGEIAPLFIT